MSKTRQMIVVRMRCFTDEYEQGYMEREEWSLEQDLEFLRGMLHAGYHLEGIDSTEYGICLRMISRYETTTRERFGF